MCCNTRFAGVLLALFVLMSGCGDEDGFPPVLTGIVRPLNLPVQYLFNFQDGEAPLVGEVGFRDPDGDVILLIVSWRNCGSEPVNRLDIVQEDLERKATGVIPFFLAISTDCPTGVYTVSVSAKDKRGYTSNVLDVPYEIVESF